MKYAILNTNEHNGTKVGVNIFYASPMLSGQHIGKFATSENALNEFPDILADLDYTIAELDPSAFEIDLTPPTPTGLRIAIPADWEIFFPEDRFIVGPFDIALERIEGVLAVDIAYLGWEAFREVTS